MTSSVSGSVILPADIQADQEMTRLMTAAGQNSTILVLDGESRAALAAVRSLGMAGYSVWTSSFVARPIAGASRFCFGTLLAPNPGKDPTAYADWLRVSIESIRPAMLLPITDVSLQIVTEIEDTLRCLTTLPGPNHETLEIVTNKNRLIRRATALGLNCPQTLEISANMVGDAGFSDALRSFSFPVCLKPVASQSRRAGGFSSYRPQYPRTAQEVISHVSASEVPLLLQQYIAGEGVGYFALCVNGQVGAEFAHRRILEKPPSGGVSVLSESIPLSDAPVDESRRLLRDLEWTGVAMVEYKRSTDGKFWLMEINPRFWGSLQLAIDCGRDFPRYLAEVFLPDDSSTAARLEDLAQGLGDYKTGRRLRWLLGTADHFWSKLKQDYSGAFKDLLFANSLHLFERPWCTSVETLRLDDIQPFFRELGNYFFPHEP